MRLFKSKQEREDERKAEFIGFLQSAAGRKTISETAVDIINSKFTLIVNDVQGQLLNAAKDQLINFQTQLQCASAAQIAAFTAYADETLKAAKGQFINFLRSEDGKRLMLDLLTEASARGALAPILGAAETRLKNLAADEIATFLAHAEISLKASTERHAVTVGQQKGSFDSHADKITRDIANFIAKISANFDDQANEITRGMANHVISDVERRLSAYQTDTIARITDQANLQIHWLLEELPTRLRDAVDRHVWSGRRFSSNRELAAAHGIASDRDMFVFLADEDRRIEVAGRNLARGFFVWNSQEGDKTLGAGFFLFDYVCCNRIVWGATEYQEVRMRHTKGAPDRWLEDVVPVLTEYSAGSAKPVVQAIEEARSRKVADDLDAFLAGRFGKCMVDPVKAIHETEEGRPIETLWDVTVAATAHARSIPNTDKRLEVEREAGVLLKRAA